jgi:transposase
LGLGELVDELVPQDLEQRSISVGQAVKAMVLNGLGFANRRLYLTTRFFQNKPTGRLLGEGIEPEHLNDDALGKALDDLYAYGVSELYPTFRPPPNDFWFSPNPVPDARVSSSCRSF